MTDTQRIRQVHESTPSIAKSSLQVGAFTGGVGFLFGGTSGIIRGTTPFLFATASGLQTFALGSTFWATRSGVLHAWDTGKLTPSDLTKASTVAGGISGGAIALITRGRYNVIPAALMWSLFCGVGQITVNTFQAPREVPKESFWKRMTEKKWSPVTFVSNEDYAKILQEKMLKIDVEIAILDDRIAALRTLQNENQSAQEEKPRDANDKDQP